MRHQAPDLRHRLQRVSQLLDVTVDVIIVTAMPAVVQMAVVIAIIMYIVRSITSVLSRATLFSVSFRYFHYRSIDENCWVRRKSVRRPGIEPGSQEWESCMIPLHQRRRWVRRLRLPDPLMVCCRNPRCPVRPVVKVGSHAPLLKRFLCVS